MAAWEFSKYGFGPKSLNKQFDKFLFGEPPSVEKMSNLSPGQEDLHNTILGELKKMLAPGGGYNLAQQYNQNLLGNGPESFQKFSDPYMQQFNEQVLPQIAERFAGGGALSSSGFGQALGGAASNFQSSLAQMFSQMQQQAAGQEYGQYNQQAQFGLGTDVFSNYEKPGSQGMAIPLISALLKVFGGM